MKEKPYTVIRGRPGQGTCKIVRKVDVDTYVNYWGKYFPNNDSWKLDSFQGTPAKYVCKGMVVRAADVSYKPERDPAPPKKEEPREKRWRYPGDPDGQIGMI